MAPRWPKMAPGRLKMAPRRPHDGSKTIKNLRENSVFDLWLHLHPWMAQDGPGMARESSKMTQDGPSWPKDDPRWPQDGSAWTQDGSTWPENGPKMAPRTQKNDGKNKMVRLRPQFFPEMAQEDPKMSREAHP